MLGGGVTSPEDTFYNNTVVWCGLFRGIPCLMRALCIWHGIPLGLRQIKSMFDPIDRVRKACLYCLLCPNSNKRNPANPP